MSASNLIEIVFYSLTTSVKIFFINISGYFKTQNIPT